MYSNLVHQLFHHDRMKLAEKLNNDSEDKNHGQDCRASNIYVRSRFTMLDHYGPPQI